MAEPEDESQVAAARGWQSPPQVPQPTGFLKRALAAVLIACCLAVVAACAANRGTQAGPSARGSAEPAVEALLDRRAAAVLDRDEKAFLDTVDPRAAGFREEQRTEFGNLARVPLASWDYRLVRTGAFPLPGTEERRIAAEVRLRYRVDGYDTRPVAATEYLTFTERDGRWRLSSDSDGDRAGRRTAAQLWDLGEVRAVRGARTLVLGLGNEAALRRYAAEADRAVPAVESAWDGEWAGRVVIEVPGSLEQMAALLDAPARSYRGIAAVTTGEAGGSATAPAQRVIVNPDAFGELGGFGRQVVLTHETAHVATRAHTAPWTPLWLSEGFADWMGYRGTGRTPAQIAPELARDVRAGRVPQRLPGDADFSAGHDGVAQAYGMSWLACRLIAERYGEDRLVAFYKAVGEDRERGVDRAMRDVLGIGLPDFTRQWRARTVEVLA